MKTGIVSCSRRRKRKKDFPFFPIEIIINILSWLPAEFLHNKGKYVSKTWANIIRDPVFIRQHLTHTNAGLLIQDMHKPSNPRYLEAKKGKIRLTHRSVFPGLLLADCDGILLSELENRLYVANCVTRQVLKLPCLPSACLSCAYYCSIAYIRHTRDFKVLHPCYLDGHWHVLTVGTDMSWRRIDCAFTQEKFKSFLGRPISASGVIYWVKDGWISVECGILAVDLRDESIHCVHCPEEFQIQDDGSYPMAYGFLKWGDYLSSIVQGINKTDVFVWILKDLNGSEWTKIHKIESEVGVTLGNRRNFLVAWLDNGCVLIFSTFKVLKRKVVVSYIAHNLKTGVIRTINNIDNFNSQFILVHTDSLVSW